MSRKSSSLDLTATLRQVRDPMIKVECRACGRGGSLDRAAVEEARRRYHVCEAAPDRRYGGYQMGSEDGDRCGTGFPFIDRSRMAVQGGLSHDDLLLKSKASGCGDFSPL